MSTVVIVDTSVLMNVLDIPGFNQQRGHVFQEFGRLINQSVNLLLPTAAIFEAGNHIAHLADGGERRRWGVVFADAVRSAIDGEAPWTPTQGVELNSIREWMNEFPDSAMRGAGMGDLSIVKEWHAACVRHRNYRVRIWSLDGDLAGYDRKP
jgi:hypothetical protein